MPSRIAGGARDGVTSSLEHSVHVLDLGVVSESPEENLQLGLRVELAVLPPYLYALWSIRPAREGASPAAVQAADSIRSVVYEEMLHAALAGNLLCALGATPVTTDPMTYPGPLPGHTTDPRYEYTVHLGPLSHHAVKTFMKIERPDWVKPADDTVTWITIADLYEKVRQQLKGLGPNRFHGGRQLRVGDNPGPGQMIQVRDFASASLAIDTIIDQGEGHRPSADTVKEMTDDDHEVAHFYQFEQIGKYLAEKRIGADDIYPVVVDPDPARYTPAQQAANAAFNRTWSDMLDSLEQMWSSATPRVFGVPTDLMGRLGHLAAEMRALGPIKDGDQLAGPTFQYLPRPGGAR